MRTTIVVASAILAVLMSSTAVQAQQTDAPSTEEVAEAQRHLKTLGYYTSEVDGLNGPGTSSAVLEFERIFLGRETGNIDRDLITVLTNIVGLQPELETLRPRQLDVSVVDQETLMITGGFPYDSTKVSRSDCETTVGKFLDTRSDAPAPPLHQSTGITNAAMVVDSGEPNAAWTTAQREAIRGSSNLMENVVGCRWLFPVTDTYFVVADNLFISRKEDGSIIEFTEGGVKVTGFLVLGRCIYFHSDDVPLGRCLSLERGQSQ